MHRAVSLPPLLLLLLSCCHPCRACPPCEPELCPDSSSDCPRGLKKDPCDCCRMGVCLLLEGDSCLTSRKYGSCGTDAVCQQRTDLSADGDRPESLCVCSDVRTVCSFDNVTYSSLCRLLEEGETLAHWGPCHATPQVVTPPLDSTAALGEDLALSCEATGYPVPEILWHFQAVNGMIKSLPGDDPWVTVQSRGGPEPYTITSWVQIQALRISDAGTYACLARNSEGAVRAVATLSVSASSD